jgi:alkylation response protein AidB-like acyl-CoA dehydrogenase
LDTLAIAGMDPSLGLVHVTGTAAPTWIDADAEYVVTELIALAQRALAVELAALAQVMTADAVQYACDRRQYDRAIGSFQAVQHRLADARAAVTGAAVVAEEAFADGSPWTATVAKALAGRAFETASRQSQQVYGAIGFTWEHDFHRSLRRGYVLDALFGDWRSLEEEIGRTLAATRSVPRIGSL